jgi:hypothetical protein
MSFSKCGLCKSSIALCQITVKIVAVFSMIKACDKWNGTTGNVWTVLHINYYCVNCNRLLLLQIILMLTQNFTAYEFHIP